MWHRRLRRRLGLVTEHRRALLRNLVIGLVDNSRIRTTYARAKEASRFAEKLVTVAKRGDLHARRLLISKLNSRPAAKRLVEEIAPLFKGQPGGYTRVLRYKRRPGDGAEVALLEFTKVIEKPAETREKKKEKKKKAPKEVEEAQKAVEKPPKKAEVERPKKEAKPGKAKKVTVQGGLTIFLYKILGMITEKILKLNWLPQYLARPISRAHHFFTHPERLQEAKPGEAKKDVAETAPGPEPEAKGEKTPREEEPKKGGFLSNLRKFLTGE